MNHSPVQTLYYFSAVLQIDINDNAPIDQSVDGRSTQMTSQLPIATLAQILIWICFLVKTMQKMISLAEANFTIHMHYSSFVF